MSDAHGGRHRPKNQAFYLVCLCLLVAIVAEDRVAGNTSEVQSCTDGDCTTGVVGNALLQLKSQRQRRDAAEESDTARSSESENLGYHSSGCPCSQPRCPCFQPCTNPGCPELCVTKEDPRAYHWLYTTSPAGTACVFGVDPADEGHHCILSDGKYGSYGWCYTSKDKSSWGSCSENCPLYGLTGLLGRKVNELRKLHSGQVRQACTCKCSTPCAGTAGHNRFECTDGSHGHCALNEECYAKSPFQKFDWASGCRKVQPTCKCVMPGTQGQNQFKCTDGTTGSCATNELCFATQPFTKGIWTEGCQPLVTPCSGGCGTPGCQPCASPCQGQACSSAPASPCQGQPCAAQASCTAPNVTNGNQFPPKTQLPLAQLLNAQLPIAQLWTCEEGMNIPHGARCTTRCAQGYEPSISNLTCNNGIFDAQFTCQEMSCTAPDVVNMAIDGACKEGRTIQPGSTCTAQCVSKEYKPSVASLTCIRGNFTPGTFTCEPCDCKPQCKYRCTDPKCDEECSPECLAPECQTRCPNLSSNRTLNDAGCQLDCTQKDCRTVCPKETCAQPECAKCKAVCSTPRCSVKCPDAECKEVCKEPKCTWKCKRPDKCPLPVCKMHCEVPRGCTNDLNELPPVSDGMAVVNSFQSPTAEVTVSVKDVKPKEKQMMGTYPDRPLPPDLRQIVLKQRENADAAALDKVTAQSVSVEVIRYVSVAGSGMLQARSSNELIYLA